jgi:type IV secretory pathway VirB10-like protein
MTGTRRQTMADRIGATIIGAVGILFLSPSALGQSNEDALAAARACSRIADDAERLACLDEALGVEAVRAEPAAPVADAGEAADLAEVPAAQPDVTQPEVIRPAEVAAAAPAAAESVEAELREDAVEATPSRSERRRERRRAAAEEVERTVRIVEIRRSGLGVATFVAEDGEAWVERSASAVRFPQTPFDAVLRPAMGDSYFLTSSAGSSRARVVPLR